MLNIAAARIQLVSFALTQGNPGFEGNLLDFSEEDIAVLTSIIFSAVLDPSRWQDFLEKLHDISGGARAHLFGRDSTSGRLNGFIGYGYDDSHLENYDEYYRNLNVWVPKFKDAPSGTVMSVEEMYPHQELIKTEFYHDWVLPQGDISAGAGAMIFNQPERFVAFGGHIRRRDQDKLEQRWLKLVKLLTPHVQQAFEITRTLAENAFQVAAVGGASGGGAALLLVTLQQRIAYCNDAARGILERGSVIRKGFSGRLEFVDPVASEHLEKALCNFRRLAEVRTSQFIAKARQPQGAYLCRTGQINPNGLSHSPFELLFAGDEPCLLLTMQPYEDETARRQTRLKHFNLTEREAQVALRLGEGLSPADIAELDGLSIHTIRNQLKSAMSKLNVRRQVELVRLLADEKGFH
jgi:DNA-binding CsgD family transcriptional regulator